MDGRGNSSSFGWDEVNDYIRHGMRVVSLEAGEVFVGEPGNTASDQSTVWCFAVVLNDYGIDPA
jgi:hypothetical protein